jgi:hypothetical protein
MVVIQLDEDAPAKPGDPNSSTIEAAPTYPVGVRNVRAGHFAGNTRDFR